MTLWQAVGNDLENDFSYPKKVTWWIENIEPFDTAKDKKGNELSRLIVDVYLENKVDTDKLRPAGYKVKWQD